MNSSNRSSSDISEHLNFQPNNSIDDITGDVELAMEIDGCGSSTSGSDHCFSTATVSILSDSEGQELSDFEENGSESSSNHSGRGCPIANIGEALENPSDHEEDSIGGEEEEIVLDFLSDSSESVIDERYLESSSDEEEVEIIPIEEHVDGGGPFQYSVEEPGFIVFDDDSEVESENGEVFIENGEELVEAAIDDEPIYSDQSESSSEHSNDSPKYSNRDQSWVVYDDSDEDMAESYDGGEFEEATLDNEAEQSEGSSEPSLENGNDLPMDDSVSIPTSESELRRNEEFLQTAPIASTASDYEPSLTSSADAEFRVFIQQTRELAAREDVQEVAVVPEVDPELLDLQVVAGEQPIDFGNHENHLNVLIANGEMLPQLPSGDITFIWVNHHF